MQAEANAIQYVALRPRLVAIAWSFLSALWLANSQGGIMTKGHSFGSQGKGSQGKRSAAGTSSPTPKVVATGRFLMKSFAVTLTMAARRYAIYARPRNLNISSIAISTTTMLRVSLADAAMRNT